MRSKPRARDIPALPVYALGESMGGAVVLSALASDDPPEVDGVILVAPAVWSRDDMPLSYRAALWLSAHTLPWLHVSGEGLKIWPSDNIPMLRALAAIRCSSTTRAPMRCTASSI